MSWHIAYNTEVQSINCYICQNICLKNVDEYKCYSSQCGKELGCICTRKKLCKDIVI